MRKHSNDREAVGMLAYGMSHADRGLPNSVAPIVPAAMKDNDDRPRCRSLKVPRYVDLIPEFDSVHGNRAVQKTSLDRLSQHNSRLLDRNA